MSSSNYSVGSNNSGQNINLDSSFSSDMKSSGSNDELAIIMNIYSQRLTKDRNGNLNLSL